MKSHTSVKNPLNDEIYININGALFKRNEAKISVFDSGFLLGDGVWEGIRLHHSKLLFIDAHLDRLFNSAKGIDLKIHLTKNEIISEIFKVIHKNQMTDDVHIRLVVTRGDKITPYQNPNANVGPINYVIIPEHKKASVKPQVKGITLGTVKTIRDNRTQDPRINSLSKHNCIAACIEAEKLGVDEALMLDPKGYVSTCNSTNFFMISNREVWTSNGEYCLNGVTRGSVIELCLKNNVPIKEKDFKVKDVHSAEEVFVTGTFAGIIPVISVDGIVIGNGERGSLTKQLQNWYESKIEKMSQG